MHPEAMHFLESQLVDFSDATVAVLEIGSRDINGSPRYLFTDADYVGVDIEAGIGVDIVADASQLDVAVPDLRTDFDIVICAEVYEHTQSWPAICAQAYGHLKPGGIFVGTAAGEGRRAHSAVDGEYLAAWHDEYARYDWDDERSIIVANYTPDSIDGLEFYRNVGWDELGHALADAGFATNTISEDRPHGDIYWIAAKAAS